MTSISATRSTAHCFARAARRDRYESRQASAEHQAADCAAVREEARTAQPVIHVDAVPRLFDPVGIAVELGKRKVAADAARGTWHRSNSTSTAQLRTNCPR